MTDQERLQRKAWLQMLPSVDWQSADDIGEALSRLAKFAEVSFCSVNWLEWSILLTPRTNRHDAVSGSGRSPWAAIRNMADNAHKKWGGE